MSPRASVLVARLDNAGDVLLAGPTARAVAQRATVTFLAGPAGAEAASLLPGVDDVIVFDAPWSGYSPPACDRAAVDALVARVAAAGVDEALILTSDHQSPLPLALLLRLAGVRRIAAISVDYPGSLLDVRVPDPGDVHEVQRAFSVAVAAGWVPAGTDPGPLAVRGPLSVATPFARPYVVVHPGASVSARAIGEARAADAVRALRADGWRVVVTAGPAERALAEAVAGNDRDGVRVAVPRDLRALAGLVAGAAALVSGNTGPAHLAAAVGTPVVSVFAPVVPAVRWRPWAVPHVLVGDQHIVCAGCRARACPILGQPCVHDVDGAVIARAVGAVARRSTAREQRRRRADDDCEVTA